MAGALLAGLYAAGLPPFSYLRPNSNPASGDLTSGSTSTAAIASAGSEASHYGPGPWHALLVAGADPYLPVLESTNVPSDSFAAAGDGSCRGHSEVGNTSVVTFPGFDGNLSLGQAPSWLVVEMNSTGTMLMVLVINGAVQPVEFFTGPACALFELVGSLPDNAVNSSVAAAAAAQGGLLRFAHEHPEGWTTYAAADVGGAGEWQVKYSTCPAVGKASSSTAYYTFTANVSLTTGAVIGTPQAGTATCSGLDLSGPLGAVGSHSALPYQVQGWGPSIAQYMTISSSVTETNGSGQYYYTVSVTSSTGRLVWGDLVFTIRNGTGQVPRGPYFVEMRQASGCIVGEGALDDPLYLGPLFGGGCAGTQGGTASVSTGEMVTIFSLASLAGTGDLFEIHSANLGYSGNFTLTLT